MKKKKHIKIDNCHCWDAMFVIQKHLQYIRFVNEQTNWPFYRWMLSVSFFLHLLFVPSLLLFTFSSSLVFNTATFNLFIAYTILSWNILLWRTTQVHILFSFMDNKNLQRYDLPDHAINKLRVCTDQTLVKQNQAKKHRSSVFRSCS